MIDHQKCSKHILTDGHGKYLDSNIINDQNRIHGYKNTIVAFLKLRPHY